MAWCVDVEIHVDTSLSDGLTGELRLRASYSTPHRGHLQLHLSDDTTWRTWEATLGPSQLRELAKENHFGEDPPPLYGDREKQVIKHYITCVPLGHVPDDGALGGYYDHQLNAKGASGIMRPAMRQGTLAHLFSS